VTALSLRAFGGALSLDVPAGGALPDVALIYAPSGRGKTLLLESLFGALAALAAPEAPLPEAEAWFDLELAGPALPRAGVRLIVGSERFSSASEAEECFALLGAPGGRGTRVVRGPSAYALSALAERGLAGRLPPVIYLPAGRALVLPEERYKAPGHLAPDAAFAQRWRPAARWQESIEALLYAARWRDISARAEGGAEGRYFEAFADTFAGVIGEKALRFEGGALAVEVPSSGARHGLAALSEGEKQALLLSAELLWRWQPGALVLVDDPELGLQKAWQSRIFELVLGLSRARGGQALLATRSAHLSRQAPPESRLAL
jgi:hypothetical protein